MHTKDTLTGQSLALATGWSRGVTTLSGRKAPMSRLLHTVNKKTRIARAQRRRDVTAHSHWDQSQEQQTRGAPLPTALCESSCKGTEESTRQRGQPEAGCPGECAQKQRTILWQSLGSAGVRARARARGGLQRWQHSSQTNGVSQTAHPIYSNSFSFFKKKHCKWKMLLCQGMVPHI